MDTLSKRPLISVVIRTKNSEQTIGQCLAYLFKQKYESLEVIVVDSGSTDETLELAKQYDCSIVKYPKKQIFNYAKAINIGIEKTEGKYILILSAHSVLLDQNMLNWMHCFLEKHKELAAVSFNRQDSWEETDIKDFENLSWEKINKKNFKGRGMYNFCALIRRDNWVSQMFNESIPRCEDQEWIWRQMKERNSSSVFINSPKVYYNNPYYNFRKDLWDYIIMGKYVYPRYKTFSFIYENYRLAFRTLLRLKLNRSWYYFRLGNGLLKEKVLPTSEQKIQSIYHPKLN